MSASVEGYRRLVRRLRWPLEVPWVSGAVPSALAIILLAGSWELVGRVADFPFFPPMSAIVARLVEMISAGEILPELRNSLTNLVLGFSGGLTVGVVIGLLMGAYWRVEAALSIYVYTLLTAPTLVFAPILYAIFGLGSAPIIIYIALAAVDIIIITTMAAVHSVPRHMIEMGRSFGANDLQLFRRIIVPQATPLMMAGIRLGAGRAVKGMVNGEMFIAVVGLGAVVMRAGRRFDATTVLAILLVIVTIAFLVTFVMQRIDRRLTRWLPQTQREG